MKKRVIAGVLMMTLLGTTVPVGAEEIWEIEESVETVVETDEAETGEETAATEPEAEATEPVLEQVEEEIAVDFAVGEAVADEIAEPRVITGFPGMNQVVQTLTFPKSEKPSLTELVGQMPETLSVLLDDESDAIEIPVTDWVAVGDDYETSESYYFQFSPVFDEENYILSSELSLILDMPYVAVFLTEGIAQTTTFSSEEEQEIALAFGAALGTTGDNAVLCYRFLTSVMGLTRAQACGILANIEAESSFRPTVVDPSGRSYGLCQWLGSRRTALESFCKKSGLDYSTITGQMFYLKSELESSEKTAMSHIKSDAATNDADGAYNAGYAFCYYFERPSDKANRAATRGNLAKNTYFALYGSGSYDGAFVPETAVTPSDNEETDEEDDEEEGEVYELELVVGQKFDAKTYLNARSYTKFTVSDAKYATVTAKGILTAKKATNGESVTVTGSRKVNGAWVTSKSTIELTVKKPAAVAARIELLTGHSVDALTNISLNDAEEPVRYASSNAKIATVDSDGEITGIKKGSAKITAYFGEADTPSYQGKVTFTVRVGELTINKKKVTMLSGASNVKLTVKLGALSISPVWSAAPGETGIAKVSENGVITAVSAGVTTITGEYDGETVSCTVTVKKPTLSIKKATLKVGKTKKITLKNTKYPAEEIEWESSAPGVATVDENGVITAISEGTTTIETTKGGCEAVCVITVR